MFPFVSNDFYFGGMVLGFFKFDLIPSLYTDRLTLREMRVSDSLDMYEYSKRADVTKYLLWSEHPDQYYTKKHIESVRRLYRSGEYYDWAIIYNGSPDDDDTLRAYRGRMIGTCGYASLSAENRSGEIGYVLNPALWGYGVATEAALEVMLFGFEKLDLQRIEARYMIGNERSERVMRKLGMLHEGVHRSFLLVKGVYRDIGRYAILRHEFYSSNVHYQKNTSK